MHIFDRRTISVHHIERCPFCKACDENMEAVVNVRHSPPLPGEEQSTYIKCLNCGSSGPHVVFVHIAGVDVSHHILEALSLWNKQHV